ncbi:MAG: hypothetical protein K8I00_09275 [Candidatus Omnitrophica bacterium]|nr:hypothetical protein [Candidatus Omnitrophota bacterium]
MTNLSLSERKKIMREAFLEEIGEELADREPGAYYMVFMYRECNFNLILN